MRLTTPLKKEVAQKLVKGEGVTQISREVGVPIRTLYRHIRGDGGVGRGELRRFIEEQTKLLMDTVPDAVDLIRDTILDARNSPVTKAEEPEVKQREANLKLRKLALDSSETVLRTASIAPTNSQSVHVQALIVGGKEALSPIISRLLGLPEHKEDIKEITPIQDPIFQEDVVEAEFHEVEGNVGNDEKPEVLNAEPEENPKEESR